MHLKYGDKTPKLAPKMLKNNPGEARKAHEGPERPRQAQGSPGRPRDAQERPRGQDWPKQVRKCPFGSCFANGIFRPAESRKIGPRKLWQTLATPVQFQERNGFVEQGGPGRPREAQGSPGNAVSLRVPGLGYYIITMNISVLEPHGVSVYA